MKFIKKYNEQLNKYRFFEITKLLYNFIWGEFCDWYLEIIKPALFAEQNSVLKASSLFSLAKVLEINLKLLHPICPFVTEKLWQELPTTKGSLIVQKFPKAESRWLKEDTEIAKEIILLINRIRAVKGENNLTPNQKVDLYLYCKNEKFKNSIEEAKAVLVTLAKIETLYLVDKLENKEHFVLSEGETCSFMLDLQGKIDFAGERKRLKAELEKIIKRKEYLQKKLENPAFVKKAPANLVKSNKEEFFNITKKTSRFRTTNKRNKMTEVKAIPDGYSTVTPHLLVSDAEKCIAFYKKSF